MRGGERPRRPARRGHVHADGARADADLLPQRRAPHGDDKLVPTDAVHLDAKCDLDPRGDRVQPVGSKRPDASINSAETVSAAISAAVGGTIPIIDAKLTSAWEKTVGNVVHVDASTTAASPTVYPLWIQFE